MKVRPTGWCLLGLAKRLNFLLDEFSYKIDYNPVSVADLHATMLHQLGLDHHKLTIPVQGLDLKLTGVEPCKIIRDILA